MRWRNVLPACLVLALLAGCGEPQQGSDPEVTLVEREPDVGGLCLVFHVTHLDRGGWQDSTLKLQLVKDGEAPPEGAPAFRSPGGSFGIEVMVAKLPDSDVVILVPCWGKLTDGMLEDPVDVELSGTNGKPNEVVIKGGGGRLINQLLRTRRGPDKPVAFDPGDGIDLITIGYAPDAYVVRLWAE
jgi:hypothetical protein